MTSRKKNLSRSPFDSEIDGYLGEPVCPEDVNILDWWRGNQSRFPCLSEMARDFLAQQTTSVPSERVFSQAGDTVTKKRNRMSSKTLRQCLALSSWDGKIFYLSDELYK
ncbi:unnamed protein product [Gordionus sp. m RMFG-2023]